MQRETIRVAQKIEFLPILSGNGLLDGVLEPATEEMALLKLHNTMLRAWRFDDRLLDL
jgi:hypothetical protein